MEAVCVACVCAHARVLNQHCFVFFIKSPGPAAVLTSQGIVCSRGHRGDTGNGHKIPGRMAGEGWRRGDHCIPDILYAESLTLLFSRLDRGIPAWETVIMGTPWWGPRGLGEKIVS